MSEKASLFNKKQTMQRYDVAVLLRKFADELAQGHLSSELGELAVENEVKLSLKGKRKDKGDRCKCSVELELSWSCLQNTI